MKTKNRLGIILIIAVLAITALPIHHCLAASANVSVNNGSTISMTAGQSGSASVSIENVTGFTGGNGIGAFTFTLSWDPGVINVTNVNQGSLPSGWTFVAGTPSGGSVTITGFGTVTPITMATTVASIQFTAVGAPGSSTSINLSVDTFGDIDNGDPVSATTQNAPVNILQQRTLTMAVDGQGSTSPSVGSHSYNEGENVSISASPAVGWAFSNWVGDVSSASSPNTTVTMNADKTVTAVFTALDTYTLNMDVSGQGTVSPATGSYSYYEGEVVSISANPANGWRFEYWQGDVANSNSLNTTVTMNANKTVTAVFSEIPTYTLQLSINGQGTITPSPGSYIHEPGDLVAISATPAEGWRFVNWTGGVADPNSPSTTVTLDANKNITANFAPRDSFALTVNIEGEGSTSPAAGTHNYARDEVVEVTATPAAGYKFDSWIGDVSDPAAATTTITIDADKVITARFVPLTYYELTIEVDQNGTTEPAPGTHSYPDGQTVSISAEPDEGYMFAGWIGDVADPQKATTTVLMDGNKTVIAIFEKKPEPFVFERIDVMLITRTEAVITWQTNRPASGELVYWKDGGQTKTISAGGEANDRHSALIEGLEPGQTYHFVLKAVDAFGNQVESPENIFATGYDEALFFITEWESIIKTVDEGKQVTINLTIANTGDMPAGYEITLKVNGLVIESNNIAFEPHSTGSASMTTLLEQPGTYEVDVNGFIVTVEVPETLPPVETGLGKWLSDNWVVVLGVVLGIILIAIIGIIILRRYYYIIMFVRR